MTESKQHLTTKSSVKTEKREQYLRRMKAITESKLLNSLKTSDFTLVEGLPSKLNKKVRVLTRCKCGDEAFRRVSDLTSGVKACSRCRAIDLNTAKWLLDDNGQPYHKVYYTLEDKSIKTSVASAKARCQNIKNSGYKNYGGRGIEFRFDSISSAVIWIRENLGYRPEGHTLDRIDNEGHYEEGNLRWASRHTQRLNQRPHSRSNEHVDRLCEARPDYHRQSIRTFIKEGLSDSEILNKIKGKNLR